MGWKRGKERDRWCEVHDEPMPCEVCYQSALLRRVRAWAPLPSDPGEGQT